MCEIQRWNPLMQPTCTKNGQEGKTSPFPLWESVGEGMVNRDCERGWRWWNYFANVHGCRTMKPAEIVLRRGRGGIKENDGGRNLMKIYCKHICKRHNESFLYNYYMLLNKNFKMWIPSCTLYQRNVRFIKM
jgi:hypothetical protein